MAGKSRQRRRLLITPSDEVLRLIDEVHELTGTPRAAIVSEILDEVAPVFMTQLEALRKLQESPREAQRIMARFANEALGKMAQGQMDLDAAVTQLELDTPVDGRTVKGRRLKKGGIRGRTP